MSLGPIVDTAIGLVFLYLLLSLVTTALQELVAAYFKSRGRMLRDAISGLVANGDKSAAMFGRVFGHALVQGTKASKWPSYVPSRNFALAVIDAVRDGSRAPVFSQVERGLAFMPEGFAKESLSLFVREAAGDVDALKTSIAQWYDDAMDRLSGEYKRNSQRFALLCGLALAVVLNVDSLHVARALWQSDTLRTRIATAAEAYGASQRSLPPEAGLSDALKELARQDMPIGWNNPSPVPEDTLWRRFGRILSGAWSQLTGPDGSGVVPALIGWMITAIAVSLGAPFWFDLLKNAVNIRSAGPRPARHEDSTATTQT